VIARKQSKVDWSTARLRCDEQVQLEAASSRLEHDLAPSWGRCDRMAIIAIMLAVVTGRENLPLMSIALVSFRPALGVGDDAQPHDER
jgi:hypothetical protein